jgi:hypothetical protein
MYCPLPQANTSLHRRSSARREGQAETGVCGGERSRGDRSLSGSPARLVRAGHAPPEWQTDLQQARCRARLEQAGRSVQNGARLKFVV